MRKKEWEKDFAQWVEESTQRQFEWGRFDCAMMAAECVEVLTGKNPEPFLFGAYYTPFGAYRILLERDGLEGICDCHLDRIHPDFAQRGDILLCAFERKHTLSVNLGQQALVATEFGTKIVPKKYLNIKTAWRVG